MDMEMSFPGGVKVEARYKGFTVHTDQPVSAGGEGSAPSPFDLFLASIGTCAGYFALRFCQQRGIDTQDLAVSLTGEREQEHGPISRLVIDLKLPREFPDKYREAIVRAVDQCTVKRHILSPPVFEVNLTDVPTPLVLHAADL